MKGKSRRARFLFLFGTKRTTYRRETTDITAKRGKVDIGSLKTEKSIPMHAKTTMNVSLDRFRNNQLFLPDERYSGRLLNLTMRWKLYVASVANPTKTQ